MSPYVCSQRWHLPWSSTFMKYLWDFKKESVLCPSTATEQNRISKNDKCNIIQSIVCRWINSGPTCDIRCVFKPKDKQIGCMWLRQINIAGGWKNTYTGRRALMKNAHANYNIIKIKLQQVHPAVFACCVSVIK